MDKLSFKQFDEIYQSAVSEVYAHWSPQMQAAIARHNVAWAPGRTDFQNYLKVSSIRFYKAYSMLVRFGGTSLCDVGGFWGVWPVTAAKLGFDVAMTETLKFYDESFMPLFEQIENSGVQIFDHDPFSKEPAVPRRFDLVTVMAVLEHYPHSLRTFILNMKRLLGDGGKLFFDVPNIAYWPKRTAMLRGESPLSDIADIYESDEPFIGHHHEFTARELRDLARLGGLRIVHQDFYNYSLADQSKLRMWLRHPIMSAALALSRTSRECIAVLCEIESDASAN